ncbi:MAG: hypothetical protein WCT28_01760 [Patescibacteria group bacterium]|jgi:hypothetical protein
MPKLRRASLTKIGSLLEGTLRRHGVAKQVAAAIIIDRANDVLDALLGDTQLRKDVRAISFLNGTLVIGCNNAGASYDIDGMASKIITEMKEEVPEVEIFTVTPRVQIERGKF